MVVETSTDIEEVRDRNGDVARPATDETLADVLDAVGNNGVPINLTLGGGETVSVPTGKMWNVEVTVTTNASGVYRFTKLDGTDWLGTGEREQPSDNISTTLFENQEISVSSSHVATIQGFEEDL